MADAPLPADDLRRPLNIANADDPDRPHLGVAGDTYTVLLSGKDTAGRYCLIDMYVPPGGGPPPHRHDFEESFTILSGAVELYFRGETMTLHAPGTVHIPANAPHSFKNTGIEAARLLCIASPAGLEEFFAALAIPVPTRTTPPPPPDPTALAEALAKLAKLAPAYRTELL